VTGRIFPAAKEQSREKTRLSIWGEKKEKQSNWKERNWCPDPDSQPVKKVHRKREKKTPSQFNQGKDGGKESSRRENRRAFLWGDGTGEGACGRDFLSSNKGEDANGIGRGTPSRIFARQTGRRSRVGVNPAEIRFANQ